MLSRMLSAVLLVLVLAPAVAASAESEPKLTLLPTAMGIRVEPEVAAPGVPRKITVSGQWPNGCIPTEASLAFNNFYGRPSIGILLSEPLTFVACFSAVRPYSFELTYTPESAGQIEIVAMTNLTKASARATLVTSSAQETHGLFDVTGVYYDPQTLGSGITVTHDHGRTDQVFGTWHTYDPATGTSRWYSLQQGFWSASGTQWTGTLFETEADPSGSCNVVCSVPFARVRFLGVVRLTFGYHITSGGMAAILDLVQGDGSTVRKAQLMRMLPDRPPLP